MSHASSYTPASIHSPAIRRRGDVRAAALKKSWLDGTTSDWQPCFQPIAKIHAPTFPAGNPVATKMCVALSVHGVCIKGRKN